MANKSQSVDRLDENRSLEVKKHLLQPGKVLLLEHIEGAQKPVFFALNYIETAKLAASDKDLIASVEIRRKIENGEPLEDYYRGTRNYDFLLHRHGIMHLHLSSKSSRAVLYLVQFELCVLFLRISSHIHLTERPVGLTLRFEQMITEFMARRLNRS